MKREIDIYGVPLDLGANIRGSNMGPAAIRISGLFEQLTALGYKAADCGDIAVPVREAVAMENPKHRYSSAIRDVCEVLYLKTLSSLQNNRMPVTVGGDHSLAVGSISAVSDHYHDQNKEFGLIWIDAHADLNTPDTSPSGNVHGMPLAVVLGQGPHNVLGVGQARKKLNPKKVALVGIRVIDQVEKDTLRNIGINYFTMREIDERGMRAVMEDALSIVTNGTDGVHLSFDIDAVDPLYAPGVSTPSNGGLSYREAHLALEMLADKKILTSMELVELNPMYDERHRTASLVVELISSALGKTIV